MGTIYYLSLHWLDGCPIPYWVKNNLKSLFLSFLKLFGGWFRLKDEVFNYLKVKGYDTDNNPNH